MSRRFFGLCGLVAVGLAGCATTNWEEVTREKDRQLLDKDAQMQQMSSDMAKAAAESEASKAKASSLERDNVLAHQQTADINRTAQQWQSQAEQEKDQPVRPESLTQRETDILALLSEGRSNREIARALFLSEKTVKAHLAAVFRKLGVANRTQAAMAAVSMGMGPGR